MDCETQQIHKSYTVTSLNILLVEDNQADVRLTLKAFQKGRLMSTLYSVEDGEQAMAFLRREGSYADAIRPDLILLDLNMPNMDGREVLAEIKNDPDLMTIPVLILTTSDAEQDILQSYRLHANCYIAKPVKMDRFVEVVGTIKEFWINAVKIPSKD